MGLDGAQICDGRVAWNLREKQHSTFQGNVGHYFTDPLRLKLIGSYVGLGLVRAFKLSRNKN